MRKHGGVFPENLMKESLIVIPALQEIDCTFVHPVNQAVFLGDSAGPRLTREVFQGFGFARSAKRVPGRRFHEIEHSQRRFRVASNPPAQVFPELLLNDTLPNATCRCFARFSGLRLFTHRRPRPATA